MATPALHTIDPYLCCDGFHLRGSFPPTLRLYSTGRQSTLQSAPSKVPLINPLQRSSSLQKVRVQNLKKCTAPPCPLRKRPRPKHRANLVLDATLNAISHENRRYESKRPALMKSRPRYAFGTHVESARPHPSKDITILSRSRCTAATLTTLAREPARTRRTISSPHNDLLSNFHNPFAL